MEKNEEYAAIISAAETLNPDGTKGEVALANVDRDVPTEELIMIGGGGFSTNTLLFRTEFTKNFPDFYLKCCVEDYPLILYLSLCGKVYFLKEKMTVYRICSNGSWTERVLKSSFSSFESHYVSINKTLEEFNEYSNKKFDDSIKKRIELNYRGVLSRMRIFSCKNFNDPKYKYLKKYAKPFEWQLNKLYARLKIYDLRNKRK